MPVAARNICSACNIQVHKTCLSFPRHIKLTLHPHPHPISHCLITRILELGVAESVLKKVNIEYGSYCSQPGCDFVIHVKCSIQGTLLYNVVKVEKPDEFEESDLLSDESTTSIMGTT
ncbi:hypothetical protein GQ457_06G024440 [Hibiscus cannabinus]